VSAHVVVDRSSKEFSHRTPDGRSPVASSVWTIAAGAPFVGSPRDDACVMGFGSDLTPILDAPSPPRLIWALQTWRLRRVMEYVDTHLASSLPLSKLAMVAGLSRMHFAAQFKMATGSSPHQFVLKQRVERAKTMLADTKDELVDVALSVGFQSQAHFTTVFRRFAGETPGRWRCRNRSLI
jgi:AraC-like DNA-binding protein